MGMSTIAAQVILFTVLIYAMAVLIITIKDYSISTTDSFKEKQELSLDAIKTDVDIINVTYDYTDDNITVNMINSGKTVLKLSYVDVYVDGLRIPRNESNRTINMISSTDVYNPGLWDPDEEAYVIINKSMGPGTYRIDVFTQYKGKATKNLQVV